MIPSKTTLGKIARRAAALGAAAVLFLIAAEIAVRALLPQYAMTGLVEKFEMGPSSDERFQASGTMGWEHKASTDTPVDALGFLTTHEPGRRKDRDEIRLLLVGDSLGEALVRTADLPLWERFLSRAWRKRVEFWTFAVGGYRIDQFDRVLRFKADHVRPDVVVLSFCPLDPYSRAPVVLLQDNKLFVLRNSEFAAESTVIPALFTRSQLYRFLWLARVRGRRSRDDFKQADDAPFADIASWCRERHVRLYAVLWPLFVPPGRYPSAVRLGRETILSWVTKNRVPFLDLQKDFPPGYWSRFHGPPGDDIHPNDEGYREATRLIWDFLAKRD
jgi:hypothetical protein